MIGEIPRDLNCVFVHYGANPRFHANAAVLGSTATAWGEGGQFVAVGARLEGATRVYKRGRIHDDLPLVDGEHRFNSHPPMRRLNWVSHGPRVARGLDKTRNLRMVVLTAEGKNFCVGGDLNLFAAEDDLSSTVATMTAGHLRGTGSPSCCERRPVRGIVKSKTGSLNGAGGGTMTPREDELRSGLSAYLSREWNTEVRVETIGRIPGGASRETWRCAAMVGEEQRGLIVRLDPETSLIDTDRATEYRAMDAAHRAGVPTPEPLFLEADLSWLGRPFSITSEVTGCQASADAIPDEHRETMGRRKWTLLGEIAALDPLALGLADAMPATTVETCAMEQMEYWAGVIAADEIHPNPVAEAAVRWLRRNPPPPARKLSLVHGDYRTGNFLYTPEGGIAAILDWEMAHLGDPLEDLAWSLDPLWCWHNPHQAGLLLPHDDAIRCWEAASGLEVEPDAMNWWRVFASVKAISIWISSSEDYHNGTSKQPILAMAGWLMTDRQQRILADYLSPHSPHRFYEFRA